MRVGGVFCKYMLGLVRLWCDLIEILPTCLPMIGSEVLKSPTIIAKLSSSLFVSV